MNTIFYVVLLGGTVNTRHNRSGSYINPVHLKNMQFKYN